MRRTSPCLKGVLEFWTVIVSIGTGRRTSVRGVRVSTDWLLTEEYTLLTERECGGELVNDEERNNEKESDDTLRDKREADMSCEVEGE